MPKQRNAMGILADVKCPIPGCTDRRLKTGLVCIRHGVEIWQQVQRSKGEPEIHQIAVESVAERERKLDEAHRKNIEFNKRHGQIYYLRLDEKIKIGWSANLGQRLMSYPPHMVLLADHPGNRADERDLHRTFRPSLAAGREWYHPTQELLDHIQRIIKSQCITHEELQQQRLDALARMPGPIKGPIESRPLRGGALVRAILAGEVD